MEELDKIFKKKIPETLYHYTNGDSFSGIIKNKEMWASHIRFMNDLKEEILALDILERELPKLLANKSLNTDCVMKHTKSFFKTETYKKGIFILSFSENKDDLNMWRGYANKIPSYSIGFDFTKMMDSGDSEKIESDISVIETLIRDSWNLNDRKREQFILPCIYDTTSQEKLIQEIVTDSIAHINHICNAIKEKKLGEEFAKRLIFYAPLIKHKMSESEKEWRIIIIYEKSVKPNFTKDDVERNIAEAKNEVEEAMAEYEEDCFYDNETRLKEDKLLLNFRMGTSFIVPYFKFHFEIDTLKEIISGACPDKESVRESTVYFLSKNGFSYKKAEKMISHTNNPYRNW